jgi:hypothetical protein
MRLVARWESRSGKWFVEVHHLRSGGYMYEAPGAGGVLNAGSDTDAIRAIQAKVDAGLFQPDSAKTPMRRVGI